MQYIHKFETIEQAENAINIINQGEGIPISEEATTRTYCEIEENENFFYIYADNITEKYLGKSIEND